MSLKLEDSTIENISSLLDILSKEVLAQNKGSEPVQNDLFYVLIIVLMLENGFLPVINDSEVKESVNSYDVQHLIPKKLETGLYEAKFVMFGCSDMPLKLIISPMGALMLINLVINDMNGETYSVCLPISRYVVSPRASSIPMIFRDLKHLSVTFKNKVLSAVKSKILSNYGYPSASLVGLPDEIILFNILPYLPARDILNISETCKRLKAVASNDGLWREMYKRDYKDNTTVVTSWKTLYKEKYLLQEKTKNSSISIRNIQDHRSVTSFYPDERNIPFYIFPLRDVI